MATPNDVTDEDCTVNSESLSAEKKKARTNFIYDSLLDCDILDDDANNQEAIIVSDNEAISKANLKPAEE